MLGAGGFVGHRLGRALRAAGTPYLGLGRDDLDLSAPGADAHLARLLRADDAVIVLATVTPRRDRSWQAFPTNIGIAAAICSALTIQPIIRLVYVSSDAVYPSSDTAVVTALDETARAAPEGIYGVMHLSREMMLAEAAGAIPLAIVRPVMLLGADDPHNAYGPNRFCRAALSGREIALYGEGEDVRDYLDAESLVRLLCAIALQGGTGILNAASGHPLTARQAAEVCFAAAGKPAAITVAPRLQAASSRRYDTDLLRRYFPDIAVPAAATAIAALVAQARQGAS